MNKTKSKVLSLVLASAMIVSSFSSLNFASAATRTETGEIQIADNTGILNSDDEAFLVSQDTKSDRVPVEAILGNVSVVTYDNEDASDPEFDKASHVSGDKILSVEKDGDDYYFVVKGNASGKEVLNIRYTATYDRDDKEYTVRADKDITVYCDEAGEVFLGEANEGTGAGAAFATYMDTPAVGDRPDAVPTAAVNQKYLDIGAYYAVPENTGTTATALQKITAKYAGLDLTAVQDENGNNAYWETVSGADVVKEDNLELKNSSKIFEKIVLANTTTGAAVDADVIAGGQIADNTVRLVTEFEGQEAKAAPNADQRNKSAKLLSVGNNTLEMKLGKVIVNDTSTSPVADGSKYVDFDGSKQDTKVYSEKKFDADLSLNDGYSQSTGSTTTWEINKKSGKTYLIKGSLDWDSSDAYKDSQKAMDGVISVGSYDKILIDGTVKVIGGTIGDLEAGVKITVEDGTTGYLKSPDVTVEDGSVGTIKDKATKIEISGGKVKNIDADDAEVTIEGGEIAGDVVADTITIDAEDDDINTVINGNVSADNDAGLDNAVEVDASSDASVTVKGTIKAENGDVQLSGDNVTLGNIDVDYDNNLTMDDFTGTIKAIINGGEDTTVEANGETIVTVGGKLAVDSLEIEEDSKVTVSEANLGALSGEGTFAFPAGKLYVDGGVDDSTKLVITDGLAVGATAFTSGEGSVDGEDLNTLGFTLETKSANSSTDKQVITAVKFAGVQFDKTALTIAKDHSDTVTVVNYPTGTALPAGYSIEWDVDVNDDYITVTTEGNVATVKAVDYSADRAVDNQGTISATVVDEDGYEVEDLLTASINVTAIEKVPSVVTLDTTKPVTVGTGAVYQYIAKSSTGAVMTATSSDTQIATVELFNAADPRGYKFQVKGIAPGTATITTTDANGASATLTVNVVKVNGTLKADTTTYTFAPGKVYDVKFSTTGTTAVPVVTVNGKVVSIAPRGNGVYRVTAQNPGTAFVVATVGNTHVSVKFVVANGAASVGVKGNNVSTLK